MRGIIVRRDDERDRLVVVAEPEEVARFASGTSVEVSRHAGTRMIVPGPKIDEHVFDATGRCLGRVVQHQIYVDQVDTSSWGDEYQMFRPGRRRWTITVEGGE